MLVWEDRDEDVVSDYRLFEGHADDITALACHEPCWAATGGTRWLWLASP